jgi:hypothetical protein
MQQKMESYSDDVWSKISQNIIPKDFIRVFAEKLNWGWISTNYPLDEDFIEEFQYFVDWEAVSQYKILSGGLL